MDWKKLIADIQAKGFSQIAIADRLGRSQAWVSAASNGKYQDVSWKDGQGIISLHAEVCPAANSKNRTVSEKRAA